MALQSNVVGNSFRFIPWSPEMITDVSICNKSLSLLGFPPIVSLLDENDASAIICNAAYEMVKGEMLEIREWTFAVVRGIMEPSPSPPLFGYENRFVIPANVSRVVEVSDNPGFDPLVRGKFKWVKEADAILSDANTIYARWLLIDIDENLFTPAFTNAFSYRLAAEIAMPLSEDMSKVELFSGIYELKIREASAQDGGQGVQERITANRITGARWK